MQIIKKKPGTERKGPLIIYDEIEPEEYPYKEVTKCIAIWDTETDPFLAGRVVKPFTCGFHVPSHDYYIDFWGDDNRTCVVQFFDWLGKVTAKGGIFEAMEFQILVHNGGNFDFYFMVEYFDDGHSPFIINGRIVRVMAQGQEFRDSYAMIPVALGDYDKIKIDYDIMETWNVSDIRTKKATVVRELFKDEIRTYQKRDCTALGELVVAWYDKFGDKLTMASAALPMLRSFHGFEQITEWDDSDLRPYYFGGRNQCFGTGVLRGNFKVYDINSSYPDVMRKYKHPISSLPRIESAITEKTCFAHIRAWSLGALPVRNRDGSLGFPIGTHDFYACIHEINAGIATKTLRIIKVYSSIYFDDTTDFGAFVDHFYGLRMEAKRRGDAINTLFYKLVLNSSYGKFAQDPRRYENWLFNPSEAPTPEYCGNCWKGIMAKTGEEYCSSCSEERTSPYGWFPHTVKDGYTIYASPQRLRAGSFFNVATAASITSGARASLLYGIQSAYRPVYCDTDSVTCEGFEPKYGISIGEDELGAWKCEAEADTVCLAGKKLYVLYKDGIEVKKASKGVKLTGAEIMRVCAGETVEYAHPVPKFSLAEDAKFTTRKIRMTT